MPDLNAISEYLGGSRNFGHGKICECCLKPIDDLAGNPGKWGSRSGDFWYHWSCIRKAVDYFVKYTEGTYLSPRDPEWPNKDES